VLGEPSLGCCWLHPLDWGWGSLAAQPAPVLSWPLCWVAVCGGPILWPLLVGAGVALGWWQGGLVTHGCADGSESGAGRKSGYRAAPCSGSAWEPPPCLGMIGALAGPGGLLGGAALVAARAALDRLAALAGPSRVRRLRRGELAAKGLGATAEAAIRSGGLALPP